MSRRAWSRVRNGVLAISGVLVAFVAIIGFAHTPAGRPLRPLLGFIAHRAPGACPLGYGAAATPEQRENTRRAFTASHHGDAVAPARPALGFALDTTTKSDVVAWAKAGGVSCKEPHGGHDLECSDVPDGVVPAAVRGASLQSLWLDFGDGGRLLSVTAVRHDASAAAVSAAFVAVTRDVASEAGAPSATTGDPSAQWLSAGSLRQASAEYRFQNYYALARATNMGEGHGFLLTEVYRSLGG